MIVKILREEESRKRYVNSAHLLSNGITVSFKVRLLL